MRIKVTVVCKLKVVFCSCLNPKETNKSPRRLYLVKNCIANQRKGLLRLQTQAIWSKRRKNK